MGALGRCCGSRNLFSRRQKPAPEKRQRQPETAAETLCEVARATGLKRHSRNFHGRKPLDSRGFASPVGLFYGA